MTSFSPPMLMECAVLMLSQHETGLHVGFSFKGWGASKASNPNINPNRQSSIHCRNSATKSQLVLDIPICSVGLRAARDSEESYEQLPNLFVNSYVIHRFGSGLSLYRVFVIHFGGIGFGLALLLY